MAARFLALVVALLAVMAAACSDPAADTSGDGPSASAGPRVVAISVDALRASALSPELTPNVHRLLTRGAGTRNARTAYEQTETLPNHTCMVTGRPISGPGGHGVTWNEDTDQAVRDGVASVFSVVAGAGGSSAVVVGEPKLDLLHDSWDDSVDAFAVEEDAGAAADVVRAEIGRRDLVFWHLGGPDDAGHDAGWGSEEYRDAVRSADEAVGAFVDALAADPALSRSVSVVLTADHGNVIGEAEHDAAAQRGNYTVPLLAWGPDVVAGSLYRLNPGREDPGAGRPAYDGPQPVRNCDLANVVTGLLGLPDVPGSRFGAGAGLRLTDRPQG